MNLICTVEIETACPDMGVWCLGWGVRGGEREEAEGGGQCFIYLIYVKLYYYRFIRQRTIYCTCDKMRCGFICVE